MSLKKIPLDFELYQKYEVDQQYQAWVFEYVNVSQDRLDEIEFELQQQGNKIFHIETYRANNGLYNVKIITAKMPYTF